MLAIYIKHPLITFHVFQRKEVQRQGREKEKFSSKMANRYNHRITADIVPMDIGDEEDEDTTLPLVPHLKRNLLGNKILYLLGNKILYDKKYAIVFIFTI